MEVIMDNILLNGSELATGYDRILIDILFDLAAGNAVEQNFRYEDQLDYYRLKIFGEKVSLQDLTEYADKYKKATKIMFPCSPEQIRSKSFIIRLFAGYVVVHNMYRASSFDEIMDENDFVTSCIEMYELPENIYPAFEKEIYYLYGQYTAGLTYEQYSSFCSCLYMFIDTFEQVFRKVAGCVLGHKTNINKDSFIALCEKCHISDKKRIVFKLQVDALAEVKVCESDFVEYYESLKYSWEKKFPEYEFCDEVKDYVNEHKRPFVLIYGNQLRNLRKEMQLFEMLACVNIKIALANGVRNYRELDKSIKKQTYDLAENLRNYFVDNKRKIIGYYRLDDYREADFEPELNEAMIPFKKDLMYLNELIMEEINYRNQDNAITKKEKSILKTAKRLSDYEGMLSEKDEEIDDLKRELEYYENLAAQNFKSEVSQYDKALREMVQRLCDMRYGSVLNELYLLSAGKKTMTNEQIRSLIQNLIFVLSSMGINPTGISKIGKKVKFYSDELNEVYTFDESKVKPGMNIGHVTYPGWKYHDSELILPRVSPIEEDEE